ncbi:MAG: hypothetical protein H0X64_01925 [Gemmatimonadaceae bacterium]|nr:hypothetical protein [Gemmatimonadaceae bacterium]
MSSIKSTLRVALALGAMTAMATTAQAQVSCDAIGGPPATCNLTNTASATAPSLLRLTLSSATTALSAITSDAFDATAAAASANDWHATEGVGSITLEVRANQTWILDIDSPAATWDVVPLTHTGKDVGDIAWSLDATTFTPLTAAGGVQLDAAAAGATLSRLASTSNDLTVSYRTAWKYDTDIPGDYEVVVRYTLTAN